MVRALEQEQENYRSRLFHFKGLHDTGRHAKSLSIDSASKIDGTSFDDGVTFRSQGPKNDHPFEKQQIGSAFNRNDKCMIPTPRSRLSKDEAAGSQGLERLQQGK